MASARASVVVRTKDSAGTVEEAIASVRAQTVPTEIVVVDSGSTDATLAIVEDLCDRIVTIDPDRFTFGRALNVGAAAAATPVILALSSHTRAPSERWVERCLEHHTDPTIAGCSGMSFRPDGMPLLDPVALDAPKMLEHPFWGFSNTASSWRRDVWERIPFNEDIEACEDKEWALRVADAGFRVMIDPRLTPSQLHRQRAGTRALFERSRREARALAQHVPLPPLPLSAALARWWNGLPDELVYPPLFYRLNYYRAAEIAGAYVGQREGDRARHQRNG
jgi:rhamnosyltransferase